MKLLVLALLAGTTTPAPAPAPDPYDLTATVEMFRLPGVEYTIRWRRCGEVNAFYQRGSKRITLCYELKDEASPAVVRFVLGHEIGHAVIAQRGIPFTGLEEAAADEFAAVVMGWYGKTDDMMEMGKWWYAHGGEEDPADEHPSGKRRGLTIACLALGARAQQYGCTAEWLRASRTWAHLLGL
jgi:hypothetical protein